MSNFERACQVLLRNEGSGFVADDNGRGPSKYGITLATARESYKHCTEADIRSMNSIKAREFYRAEFWHKYALDSIVDQSVATKMLDLSVHMGGASAVKLLQGVVGMPADGILGPNTADAVNSLAPDGVLLLLRAVAETRYRAIIVSHPNWAAQLPGWLERLYS